MPARITAEDIKEIRGQYGLSQKSFALLLGIGPASMVRYEQGITPSKANANLIRAARNPQFMQECLEADGHLIPNSQRIRAEKVLYDYVSLDPEENERMHEDLDAAGLPQTMGMSEMYHFTLQQEILNEQAANLIAELISIKLDFPQQWQANTGLQKLLSLLAKLKPTIVSKDTLNDAKLAEIRGVLKTATSILSAEEMAVAS